MNAVQTHATEPGSDYRLHLPARMVRAGLANPNVSSQTCRGFGLGLLFSSALATLLPASAG